MGHQANSIALDKQTERTYREIICFDIGRRVVTPLLLRIKTALVIMLATLYVFYNLYIVRRRWLAQIVLL